jgi:hypothetical protein
VQQYLELGAKGQSPQQYEGIQALLLSRFKPADSSQDVTNRARAGLCLRCYVSESILTACKQLASRFSDGSNFTYDELLPFVLNDDGQTPVILDGAGKTQLVLDERGDTQKTDYVFFTVEVLRTFEPNRQSRLSLENWTYCQTKQNPELKNFLSEFGFRLLSDWALFNRVGVQQLSLLPDRDRNLVEAFQAVYRRDRIQQKDRTGKCPDPTQAQLREMLSLLQAGGVTNNAPNQLYDDLKAVAQQLRQYELWSRRGAPPSELLEVPDSEVGKAELPDSNVAHDLNEVEQQEFLEFLHQQLIAVVDGAIEQVLREHIAALQQRRYAPLAPKVIPGLRLIYCEGKSQGETAALLGITNQSKVSRLLNLTGLLNRVRLRTTETLLEVILARVKTLDLAQVSTNPDYLKNLAHHLDDFVEAEVFQGAAAELKAAKTRLMNSVYAQRLQCYLKQHNGVKA